MPTAFKGLSTSANSTPATAGDPWAGPEDVTALFPMEWEPVAFAALESGAPAIIGALSQVLYLTEPGDTAAISVNDIHQGQIGDCFLLASIGEIALYRPSLVSGMIKSNPNGTETVTLYTDASGRVPGFGATQFKPASQTVTNTFPTNAVNNGATQDVVGNQKEIWVQVLEKAYAQENGGYGGIQNGGNPCIALQQLTGHAASAYSSAGWTTSALTQHEAAGDLIVLDTRGVAGLPYGLVGGHAYIYEGLQRVGGVDYVKAGNPWGTAQPGLIPVTKLSSAFVEIDIGHTH